MSRRLKERTRVVPTLETRWRGSRMNRDYRRSSLSLSFNHLPLTHLIPFLPPLCLCHACVSLGSSSLLLSPELLFDSFSYLTCHAVLLAAAAVHRSPPS